MIAFEISIDGEEKCIAGVPDLGVTCVTVSWVRRVSRDPESGEPLAGGIEEELTLDVGGLTHDPDGAAVHLNWLRESLKPGQRLTLAILDTAQADPPGTRNREDPLWAEQRKRAYYERLKREYGDA